MIPLETLLRLYELERDGLMRLITDEELDAFEELFVQRGRSLHKLLRIGAQARRRRGLSRHYCKGRSRHAQRMLKFLEHARKYGRRYLRTLPLRPIGCGKTFSEFYEVFEQSTHKSRRREQKKGES